MKSLADIHSGDCRYVVQNAAYPAMFCAEPAQQGSSYCAAHHARCYSGPGKDWRALAGMMEAVEKSVVPATKFARERPETAPVDLEVREAA